MIIDELITDRTQADVDRVNLLTQKWLDGTITSAEQTEWNNGMKGAYNYTDLNRVGQAVAYVANLLNQAGRSVSVEAKTNWTANDIPTRAQMDAFLNDLSLLKRNVNANVPNVPSSMDNLTFETANRIEQIIIAVYDAINYEGANWTRSGVTYSGVVGGL